MGNFEVHKNVWYNCEMIFEANYLALWYGKSSPRANVFYDVLSGEGQFITPSRRFIEPKGTLFFGSDNPKELGHDPDPKCLNDYIEIYKSLETLPGILKGKEKVQKQLVEVINKFGGTITD